MPRIRANPEDLRDLARQMAQTSTRLGELQNSLARNWARLEASGWYGNHRAQAESRWYGCRSRTAGVARQLSDLAQWLYESASIFEETDRAGLQDIARLDTLVERFRNAVAQSLQVLGAFVVAGRAALERVLRLGGIIGDIIILPIWPRLPPFIPSPILRPPIIVWPPRIRFPPWLIRPWMPRVVVTPTPSSPGPEPPPPDTRITLSDGRQLTWRELENEYPIHMAPVSGVTETNRAYPVNAEVQSTPALRDRRLYDAVINQFGVDRNPRYQRDSKTYCNIFVWDVTRAMGAEIPRYRAADGRYVFSDEINKDTLNQNYNQKGEGWKELRVDGMRAWLQGEGSSKWRKVTAEEAQRWANSGRPAVVLDPGGTHIGVIRPGPDDPDPKKGPKLAQAGGNNFSDGYVYDGFAIVEPDYQKLEYYVAY